VTNTILLGITSLLTDFSSEMVVPILPAFIQSVGGGAVAIGLIFGIGDALAALLRVVSGYWADRTRAYKTFTLVGYLASAGAKFLYVGASQWVDVARIRPLERLGKGFRDAPRDAIISESVPWPKRGFAFGIQRAMDSAGAIFGSVAVLVLYMHFNLPFREIFLVSAGIGLIAVLPVMLVRVPKSLLENRRAVQRRKITPKARTFIGIATLFGLANFSVGIFILQAQAVLRGVGDALALALVAYSVFNIVDTIASVPAGALSDRIGRHRVVLAGYGVFALVCFGFAYLGTQPAPLWAVVLLFGGYGLFKGLVDASQRALVSDVSSPEVRGSALGIFETSVGLAAIPAGLIAGWLYSMHPAAAFLWGAGLSLLACLFLVRSIRTV
jgi:MFS family permease